LRSSAKFEEIVHYVKRKDKIYRNLFYLSCAFRRQGLHGPKEARVLTKREKGVTTVEEDTAEKRF